MVWVKFASLQPPAARARRTYRTAPCLLASVVLTAAASQIADNVWYSPG